jgi:imidazolonepropionase-like amidohydrolase
MSLRIAVPIALALAALAPAQSASPAAASAPAESVIAVVHGRVFPVTAPPIEDGVVVTRGKKIEAVGPFGSVAIPEGAQIVDATGHFVVPGFIEMHNHTGASDLHDIVFQVNPELRVVDNIQFRTGAMKTAVAGGVTTLLTIPGSGTNMGGFGVVMKTWGRTPADVVVRFPGALKIAQAGNPERFGGELGHGRMGMNWLIRNVLIEGREYHRAWTAYEKGETKTQPPRNLRYEMLRGLFAKDYPIAVHTQWFQVVQSTIRILKRELDLDPVVDHGEWEGYMNTPELAKFDIPVAAGPRGFDYDREQARFIGIVAAYFWRGIDQDSIGVNTDAPVVPQEELPYQVAMAIRLGLPEDVALKSVTINAARMLKLENRLGSLEPGKDADVCVWTGDPFDPRHRTQVVIVDGDVAYDAKRDGIRF